MEHIIVKRNKINNKNQEYKIAYKNIKNIEFIIKENEIIHHIKTGDIFYTEKNGIFTIVVIDKRNNVEYIKSIPNNSTTDNLLNLPQY